jgi:hypothetical protein
MTLDEFFAEHEESRPLFDEVRNAVEALGPGTMKVSKSQVAFGRKTLFAFAWIPDMYLGRTGVPLVLTVGLWRRDGSPRWKQVVQPAPGRFTHHLEIHRISEVDDEVRAWLKEAWEDAG